MGENRKGSIRERMNSQLEGRFQVSDEELLQKIDEEITEEGTRTFLPLEERISLRKEVFDSFRRLDILQELVDNPAVTEIMVNGSGNIFVEERGKLRRWEKTFGSDGQLEDLIQQIVSRVNRVVNFSSPIADARLADGSRVHVVLPPVSLNGPVLTIRKFPETFDMEQLVAGGSITREAADMLQELVRCRYNIFISGGTGSGKTTFLNALSGFIPAQERIITIEDSAELQIRHIENLVRLETRERTGEGAEPVTMQDLIRASLRMRPDRIIVGEVRGREALDMLQAMNTGHDGSISTGHSNSSHDMLSRLETMVLMGSNLPLPAIRSQIASALDIIIHLGRLRDRSRKVLEIAEVNGYENGEVALSPLYRFEEDESGDRNTVRGSLVRTGTLAHREKLRAGGSTL